MVDPPLGSAPVRVLAACSLGGAGHLNPLLPFLAAARGRGDETLVVGPPALRDMVERAGYPFRAGGEPPEEEVAPIRERLPLAPPAEASVLGNRELFGRLATLAMLPGMEEACAEWAPDFVLREPCEYASAVVAGRAHLPVAQVAISLAQGEAASIDSAAPALEAHRRGLVDELPGLPYLTRFPASLDPSPFPATVRFHEPPPPAAGPLPDWWYGSAAPLVYVTFGTVLGHMSIAAGVYRTALAAVEGLDIRVLLTVGSQFDRSELGPVPANVHVEAWVEQSEVFPRAELVVCHGGRGRVRGRRRRPPRGGGARVRGPVRQRAPHRRDGAGLVVESDVRTTAGTRCIITEEDAPRVRGGIQSVLGDDSYRHQARHIADEVGAAPTAEAALDSLLRAIPPGAIP